MRFLADERLYASTSRCLAWLRALPPPAPRRAGPRERCHLYWRGEIGRKQAFAIKSLLATQDLEACEPWLWLDAEEGHAGYEGNPYLRPLLPWLRVRRLDPAAEASGTPFDGHPELYRGVGAARRSDFVRFVVLYNHGGTWADMDTMFLRDMGPLRADPRFGGQFAYRWSAHLPFANSAVLRLEAHGEVARRLLAWCVERASCLPRDALLFADHPDLDLTVLPCPFFDPLWPARDGKENGTEVPFTRFEGFFRRFGRLHRRRATIGSYRDFFPGAFAYHWHKCWDAAEHASSYFGEFERELDDQLRAKLGLETPR